MASSSPTPEARLSQLQADLNELKKKHDRMLVLGTSRWESLNLEIKELRDEMLEDKLKNIKELVEATGGFGHRLKELEKKVADLTKEKGKEPKPER